MRTLADSDEALARRIAEIAIAHLSDTDPDDDPAFPRITYRRGAAGQPVPTLRETGIRVQTVAVAASQWEMAPAQITAEYELSEAQVNEALAFYEAHRTEIGCAIKADQAVEETHG